MRLTHLIHRLRHDFEGDELVDAILKEAPDFTREQIAQAIAKDNADRESALVQFLEQDIRNAMREAAQEALTKKARTDKALEPIAQEAAVNIAHLLSKAKQEFSGDAHFAGRIEELDQAYSVPVIFQRLKRTLGIEFVDELRDKLQHQLLEAGSSPNPDIDALHSRIRGYIIDARRRIAFKNPTIHTFVTEEIEKLAAVYDSRENLIERLSGGQ